MFRRLTLIVSLFFLALCLPRSVFASEAITSFDSRIVINQDTSIRIQETIKYTTDQDKHGIYRYVPVRYTRRGVNYTAKISDISVTDETGKPITYERTLESGNVKLKIGEADVTFTGAKTYVISYTVKNAVQEVIDEQQPSRGQFPELYWDITGEGWQVDILAATATVESPHAGITEVKCFSGAFGGDDAACQINDTAADRADFGYYRTINYGDNMTVAVQLDPNGGLIFPTPTQKLLQQIWDNLGLFVLLIPGIFMLSRWWRKGRDWTFASWNVFNHDPAQPQSIVPLIQRRFVPMVYEPIKELTPGEAGALIDEKVDGADIVAEIIDLARQKFLTIKREEKKKLMGLSTETDYIFTKLKDATPNLPAHQTYLLEKIFNSKTTVKLSALKGAFSSHVEQMKKLIFKSLHEKQLFTSNPQDARTKGFVIAFVLLVLTGSWGIYLLEQEIWWAIPLFGVSAAAALLSAYFMPAKTAKGTNLAWQARGLKQSIQRGAWREKIKEKHLFFEEVLPFAIALGVVDQLTRHMDKLNVKAPEYVPAGGVRAWSTNSFVNSFTTQAASSLTYNPDSSSWSSGSSGGSSGGGGGGGGGGSW